MRAHGVVAVLCCLAVPGMAQRPVLIRGAVVVDGSGGPSRVAAVRIAGGTIRQVGQLTPSPGDSVVEARGLLLAPGFIDTHSHHDRGLDSERTALAAVSQGITTIVVGQDGGSERPQHAVNAGPRTHQLGIVPEPIAHDAVEHLHLLGHLGHDGPEIGASTRALKSLP